MKTYGGGIAPYSRTIAKPVDGTVRVAVDGAAQTEGTDFLVDTTTGIVTFQPGHVPDDGAAVEAGFEFDVPVRFDTDQLSINLSTFEAGDVPNVPVVEIRI